MDPKEDSLENGKTKGEDLKAESNTLSGERDKSLANRPNDEGQGRGKLNEGGDRLGKAEKAGEEDSGKLNPETKESGASPEANNRRGLPEDAVKLRGDQGYRDSDGNLWKKDQLHKDHWDVSDRKGNKIREVDFDGRQIWPGGPKNKNK